MAKRSGKGKGKKGKAPKFSIAFSAQIKKNEYDRGPSFGLWKSDAKQVLANGPVKDDRLKDLMSFLKKHDKKGNDIYIALFPESKKSGSSSSSSSSSSSGSSSSSSSSSSASD